MTTIASRGTGEPTLPPGLLLDEVWELPAEGLGGTNRPPHAPGLAVMVHLLGAVGLVLASLTAGLVLLLLAPAPGVVVLLAGPGLGFLWFVWLVRRTGTRRATLEEDEVRAQEALLPAPVPALAARAVKPGDTGKTAPILESARSAVALG